MLHLYDGFVIRLILDAIKLFFMTFPSMTLTLSESALTQPNENPLNMYLFCFNRPNFCIKNVHIFPRDNP